jgi:3-dehydroquinate dehydratase-2
MNILILQGPNLNLLGLKSSENGKHITLDKLNKAIRKHVHGKEVTLKFLQTHKQFQAINFLQRNRNWADGLLCIPTSWAKYDWSIAETLNLINIPIAIVYFDDPFSLGGNETESIMTGEKIDSFSGQPVEACILGIDSILS